LAGKPQQIHQISDNPRLNFVVISSLMQMHPRRLQTLWMVRCFWMPTFPETVFLEKINVRQSIPFSRAELMILGPFYHQFSQFVAITRPCHVRFTPRNGHCRLGLPCQLLCHTGSGKKNFGLRPASLPIRFAPASERCMGRAARLVRPRNFMEPRMHLMLKSGACCFCSSSRRRIGCSRHQYLQWPDHRRGLDLSSSARSVRLRQSKQCSSQQGQGRSSPRDPSDCGGHAVRHSFDVWAKAALQRGYAVWSSMYRCVVRRFVCPASICTSRRDPPLSRSYVPHWL